MNKPTAREFERILIIKPSSPGDIIHALPVLHGLRRRFPGAHVAWLVATPFANLIEKDPALDEVIPFDRRRFGRMARSLSISREFASFVRALRARRFDLAIDLQGLFRSGFLALASRAGVRIGFTDARELAPLFYTHKLPRGDCETHAADRNYATARLLGFADVPMDFTIHVTGADREHAATLIDESGIGPTDPYAALVVATRWPTKCWPAERFGRLARLIHNTHGMRSLIVGGDADIGAGNSAVDAGEASAANLCGRTTLRQLAALIDRASVVVTADSTPMHLAAALNRPLVAIFGPTNPRRTGPYGRLDDVLRINLECSPCYLRHLIQCPHDHACMRRLDVDHVAQAIAERLAHPVDATLAKSAE